MGREAAVETMPDPIPAKPLKIQRVVSAARWVGLTILGAVIGYGVNYVVNKVHMENLGGEDYLQQIKAEQREQTKLLLASMEDMKRQLPNEALKDFSRMESLVSSLKRQNEDLLYMVSMARQENIQVSQQLQGSKGLYGGYDFILTAGAGLQIDNQNTLSVESIRESQLTGRLSGPQVSETKRYWRVGEAINYTDPSGARCAVTLQSLRSRESASFSRKCVPQLSA